MGFDAIRDQTSFQLKGREGKAEGDGVTDQRTAPFSRTCGADGEIDEGPSVEGNE
jgi:hypothetical protein